MIDPARVIQVIGMLLRPRIEVYLWCDECEHVAVIVKKKRTEYCSCCGVPLPKRVDEINYEGTN